MLIFARAREICSLLHKEHYSVVRGFFLSAVQTFHATADFSLCGLWWQQYAVQHFPVLYFSQLPFQETGASSRLLCLRTIYGRFLPGILYHLPDWFLPEHVRGVSGREPAQKGTVVPVFCSGGGLYYPELYPAEDFRGAVWLVPYTVIDAHGGDRCAI